MEKYRVWFDPELDEVLAAAPEEWTEALGNALFMEGVSVQTLQAESRRSAARLAFPEHYA